MMKHGLTRALSFFMMLALLAGALPGAARAADGEAVLTGLSHTAYGAAAKDGTDSTRFTFTVPYTDRDKTIGLDGTLSISYDTNTYAEVVLLSVSEQSVVAGGGGAEVTLTVSYSLVSEWDAGQSAYAGSYTSAYTVRFETAAYAEPVFTGTLSKTVSAPGELLFQQADFTSIFKSNDSAGLTAISITGINQAAGKLMLGSADYTAGTEIPLNQIGELKFAANAITNSTESVTYTVVGHYKDGNGGDATTDTTLTITANRATPDTLALGKLKSSATLVLPAGKLNEICKKATGTDLEYVTFALPSAAYGTLYVYYGTASSRGLTAGDRVYETPASGQLGMTNVTFVPRAGYNGTLTINYTAVNKNGLSYSAAMTLTIVGEIAYSTDTRTPVRFSATDFNAICSTELGLTLDYVTFTLPAGGTLYLNYVSASSPGTKVTAGTKYYRANLPSLSEITYVPPATAGKVEISYTGYSGTSSFTGKVAVTVAQADLTQISYSTDGVTPIQFKASDFNTACSSATGRTLNYVWFTSVTSTYGRLYYNYSTTTGAYDDYARTGTAYYRATSTDLKLDSVYFVPSSDITATMTFSYTGYNDQGTAFNGSVTVSVTKTSDTTIRYETDNQTPIAFSASDFNNASTSATGYTLSYIKFTSLPTAGTQGSLHYNYVSAASTGTSVTTNDSYYRTPSTSTRAIADLTFAPKSGYTGTYTINYAGYAANGASFTGKIQFTVTAVDQNVIRYDTAAGAPARFNAEDFNTVCKRLNSNRELEYVRFTLPSSAQGKLYLNYVSSGSTGTAATSSTKYYRTGSPYLSDLSFVPASGVTGRVTINYTGYDVNGNAYSGQIAVTVDKGTAGTLSYRAPVGDTIAFSTADFQNVCSAYTGETLSYVTFTLPSAAYGTLYYNYGSSSASHVTSNTKYNRTGSPTIANITFVSNSTYNGAVTINYTGYDVNGDSYSGKIEIFLYKADGANLTLQSANGAAAAFPAATFNTACATQTGAALSYVTFTLPSSAYGVLYYDYNSTSSGRSYVSAGTRYYQSSSPYLSMVSFVPASSFSGAAYISYVGCDVNGYSFSGTITVNVTRTAQQGASRYFTDVTEDYGWASAAIDALYEQGVVNGVGSGRYNPAGNITRGDFLLMLYRAFSLNAGIIQIGQFTDVPSDSYYYEAILTARALGIAQGDNNRFRPQDAITREDAMVLTLRTLEMTGEYLSAGTSSNLSGFSDRTLISDYAATAVATLVKAGLIQGSDGKINPRNSMSRAEMAVFLSRVVQ